jgi:hypothetical protein
MAPEAGPDVQYFTADVDYLLWWLRGEKFDLNSFTTNPVIGPGLLSNVRRGERRDPISGGRISVGYWFEDYDPILSPTRRMFLAGVEATGFALVDRTEEFLSGPATALVRPFFNLNAGNLDAVVVALPGLATGQLSGETNVGFRGVEANLWCNAYRDPPGQLLRADVMIGARYLELEGDLQIDQNTLFANDLTDFPDFAALAGSRLQVFDRFEAENQFYGGQLGVRLNVLFSHAEFSGAFKYALGTTRQTLNVRGGQTLTAPDGTQTVATSGLLALASNVGEHSQNTLTHVPEVNASVAVHFSRCLSVHAGYTLLYFSNVIRPAAQIDRVIDVTQIPNFPGAAGATATGIGRPTVLFRESGLVVQGVSIGLRLTW